jgi:Mg2+/citrate symporter
MKETKKTEKELKEFGMVMGLVLLLITLYLIWSKHFVWYPFFSLAFVFILSGVIYPQSLELAEKLWMKFGMSIGHVVTLFLLTLMFFFVMTPIGLFLKLCGKKLLDTHPDSSLDTYWKEVPKDGPSSRHYLPY